MQGVSLIHSRRNQLRRFGQQPIHRGPHPLRVRPNLIALSGCHRNHNLLGSPWDRRTTLEAWTSERVLKLICTAEDLLPLAEACDFTSGSFQNEYGGQLNKWDEAERAELIADLDAAFFHLYGLNRDNVEYILSTFKGIHEERTLFPGVSSTARGIIQKFSELSFPA